MRTQSFPRRRCPVDKHIYFAMTESSTLDTERKRSETSEDALSLLTKRFSAAWTKKQQHQPDEADRHGPVGLRLLHSSPEPLIDLVFVHGLRGGSVKTWRKGNEYRFFWPQYWLPAEPGFRHVNIHSFGYVSDWASTKPSILNVHDFGQSLLEEIRNSPHLCGNGKEGPIIMIGHSMGGLVIKKAYILSRQVQGLNNRIRCIFFLATPHKGSDYAATLNLILSASGLLSSRDYIRDLTSGSISTQLINDEFWKCARDLHIFSFYETLPTRLGISSSLIVEKDSAILGPEYVNERIQYIEANHRNICKFDGPDDPNYITLKNALRGAIEELLLDGAQVKEENRNEQIAKLRAYLSIADRPLDSYSVADGSCQWLDGREDFQNWRDVVNDTTPDDFRVRTPNKVPSLLWIRASPGTGKTVLAAHVASKLQESQLNCSCYFFHAGSKVSRSLSDCLRYIAYQMAISNAEVRDKLLHLCHDGSTFDLDDDRTIWTKLFKKGVMQYWVIDALDECNKYKELLNMIRYERPPFPLRILITSRNIPGMARLQRPLEASITLISLEIPTYDSMHDIECYIKSRLDALPCDEESDRQELACNILQRSKASFLWVRLVLDELEQVYSRTSILRVLEGVPEGMMPYYRRTISTMEENKREKHISKAILLWVVASFRKMTTAELEHALKLDIKEDLPSARTAVGGLCGQLVIVDERTGFVEVVHPTAREFLLSEDAADFRVYTSLAHERMALACLHVLCGRDMQPSRGRRTVIQQRSITQPLLDYAITHFSDHIFGASSESDVLLLAIDRFLRTNVLSWIEKVALTADIHCLIRTSKNLKAYLERRAKYHSPLSAQGRNVDAWAIDLGRLASKFGSSLLSKPASIFHHIPPLCPAESAIHSQFGKRRDGLSLVGSLDHTWDDCVASISLEQGRPVTAACGESTIAVGMICQKTGVLRTKWPIDIVHFADNNIATCTIQSLVFQDTEGNIAWETRLKSRCILLASSGRSIFAVTQQGHLLQWNMLDGTLEEERQYPYKNHDIETDYNRLATRVPSLASVSPDMEILALGYRGGTVCLWDLASDSFIGWARDENDNLPSKMLFNPNPDIALLLIAYADHQLALFETWSGSLVQSTKAPKDAGILAISCSPDGRTLVTCDTLMNMRIWDFESLSLLYHLESPFAPFRILNFTSDGSKIVDVTGSGLRIWSPAALVRKTIEEDASTSDDAAHLIAATGRHEPQRSTKITSLCAHPSLPLAFTGNFRGEIAAFDTKSGARTPMLYSHPHDECVTRLTLSDNNLIASSDSNGVVLVRKLDPAQVTSSHIPLVFHLRSREPVKQLCFSKRGQYLVVSNTSSDALYATTDGSHIGTLVSSTPGQDRQWIPVVSPDGNEQFVLLSHRVLETYTPTSFPLALEGSRVQLRFESGVNELETAIRSFAIDQERRNLVLDVQHSSRISPASHMLLFDLGVPTGAETPIAINGQPLEVSTCFIGTGKSRRLYFLDRDSWLSSVDPRSLADGLYTQHFLVPTEFVSSVYAEHHAVRPVITADGDVVFCLDGEVVAVRNGMRLSDAKPLTAKPTPS
ncbi:NACHT and WD domain protein [Xylariomycetidae sp. FL2044]|nr:NACHT and WD domain protein [Xylariomycetidae sp. FL2044]